jgi:hypothetical protein
MFLDGFGYKMVTTMTEKKQQRISRKIKHKRKLIKKIQSEIKRLEIMLSFGSQKNFEADNKQENLPN